MARDKNRHHPKREQESPSCDKVVTTMVIDKVTPTIIIIWVARLYIYFEFKTFEVKSQSQGGQSPAVTIKKGKTTRILYILNWSISCKNTKSGHLVVVLSALVSCVVIQTAFGRRYSELMDGRITIRRIERDTLTHLNLAPSPWLKSHFLCLPIKSKSRPFGGFGSPS